MTKNEPTIQEKIDRLQALTAWFDGDEFVLEQATVKFKEAEQLVQSIEADLADLKNDVQIMRQSSDEA